MAKVTSITSVYPMDSVVSSGEDGLPVYDRSYNAADLREVMSAFLSSGVFADRGDELAVTESGGTWSVGTGAAFAGGLYVPVGSASEVIDQDELSTGQYAYVVLAARLDTGYRDAAIYAVVTESPSYSPVRDGSTWELVLARVDWRGGMSDYRMDPDMCGPVAPFEAVDTDSFMASLHTALDQFNLNVGTVQSLPSGSTPTVVVRKPTEAGGDVYVDFGIPRGAPGEDGRDGESAPTMYVSPDDEEPPRAYGNVWMVDSRPSHTISDIRSYEADRVYPGDQVYPDQELYPGGTGQWVSHKLSPSLIATA